MQITGTVHVRKLKGGRVLIVLKSNLGTEHEMELSPERVREFLEGLEAVLVPHQSG